ncbi:MAG: bifunctional phosphopantothenoylcysteine decarboxylase/phosphopantothenate--cysteine ligase CoaBC [Flavobacteriales bacterium Tduv]
MKKYITVDRKKLNKPHDQVLHHKKLIIALCGSIAAYKTPKLIRSFVQSGANIKVIMTPSAKEFVTLLTLSTLSKKNVWSDFQTEQEKQWNNYVELGIWADAMIIAPVTANTLSKMTSGQCDNIILATYLSAKCPIFFAPAMDLVMYRHPSTKKNISRLVKRGNILIPAGEGELASGLFGEGRMAEPDYIVAIVEKYFSRHAQHKGKKILITAGPTYEALDPVRFIGNHSSGKMGFVLAKAAAEMGAEVTLISGPTTKSVEHHPIQLIRVVSALEMLEKTLQHFETTDIVIMSAAVADYRPEKPSDQKIKKKTDTLTLNLVKNPDILKTLSQKKTRQYLVGFALETDNEYQNACKKLKEKNLDLIILNSLKDPGAGFNKDTNKVTLINSKNIAFPLNLKSKKEVSFEILHYIFDAIR